MDFDWLAFWSIIWNGYVKPGLRLCYLVRILYVLYIGLVICCFHIDIPLTIKIYTETGSGAVAVCDTIFGVLYDEIFIAEYDGF